MAGYDYQARAQNRTVALYYILPTRQARAHAQYTEEVGSVVRSRGCSACARCVYWNVNYFSVIRAIAMARAVVGHRERAVPVACWPSTIYGCSYELLIGLTTSLKTIDGDCW